MKTTVYYHSADMDGLFSREIARKFLPGAELIGWDFKDAKIPFPKEGIVYVIDLSPDCFEGDIGEDEFKRLVWLDHHKSSIEKWPTHIPGYRIDGVAACRLAWQWFYLAEHNAQFENSALQIPLPDKEAFVSLITPEPHAVRLAGLYDVWDKRDPDAEVFQFGLRSVEESALSWARLLGFNGATYIELLLTNGRLLQRYQQQVDAGVMDRSFKVVFNGLTFLALNTARCNSLTFASKDVPATGHDALCGFYFDGKKFRISLYHANHRKEIDLSKIAVKYGGGGHAGACGMACESLPFTNYID